MPYGVFHNNIVQGNAFKCLTYIKHRNKRIDRYCTPAVTVVTIIFVRDLPRRAPPYRPWTSVAVQKQRADPGVNDAAIMSTGKLFNEYPDRSNTIESKIDSSRPDSTGVSWKIFRISSSVPDLIIHRAISRPGLFAGINCDESISPHGRCRFSERRYVHDQRETPDPASK